MPDPGDEAVRLRRQGDSATGPQLGALAGGAQPREEGGYTFTSEPVSVALPSTSLVDVPEAVEITAELAHVTAAQTPHRAPPAPWLAVPPTLNALSTTGCAPDGMSQATAPGCTRIPRASVTLVTSSPRAATPPASDSPQRSTVQG